MNKEEFCLELVNQFNYYSKRNAVDICLAILKLLAKITCEFNEFHSYTNKIKDKDFMIDLMILYDYF